MKKLESILAEKLLKISAIKLQPDNPFTWSSGWNSPIYTDNRKTLSYPETRSFLKVEMSRLIIENFPDAEVVAGVATGAIALGASRSRYSRQAIYLCAAVTKRPWLGKPYRRQP